MKSKIKIVIIGGGSNAWTPLIIKDMLLTESLQDVEYVLYDINKKPADLNKAFLDKLSKLLKIESNIITTSNKAHALKDANYVIITISTGGLDAMAHDIAIPEEYGIYHTVGDTQGPGGWARSIRNFGAFVDISNSLNKYCPGAMVLNYTNPMPVLTDVLQQLCTGPVIGLCHGLFENIHFLQELYGAKSEDEIYLKYAGLNHFFWITEGRVGNIDIIADLRKKLQTKSITDLLKIDHSDSMGFKSGRYVADELFRMTNYLPYLGDRHTCESFPWFITNKKNLRKYNIKRTSISNRRKMFKDREDALKRMLKGEINDKYLERSRETAADIINAHLTGKKFIDVGNVKNKGQISNLPLGTVVETACMIDKNSVTPLNYGALPDSIVGLIEPLAYVFNLTVKACFENNRELALQALRLDPVCSHLNCDQIKEMGQRLLQAHEKYVSLR
ncbi:MAG: hypothetical protein A2Y10_10570 [Planctomycetes bacterium GWF2_41_51]|nr:MAG: hypothetical protein A2Y10_10570 [Planctomycetes bacterium GWF2_41_51]HBG26919.1 hypothetical protein [Phycisphaerales bacterium]